MSKTYYQEKFIENVEGFDFNFLSNLLDDTFCSSKTIHTFHSEYLLDATIQVKDVHRNERFFQFYDYLNQCFNPSGMKASIDLFVNFTTGGNSTVHKDYESVKIIGLYGNTFYRFGDQECVLQPGDLLSIESGVIHKAVGLSPRICMSYGNWDKEGDLNKYTV